MAKRIVKIPKPDTAAIASAKDIGRFVQWRRKELGLSRDLAAMQLGLNYKTLQGIENGSGKQSLDTVLEVLFELGMELEIRCS